VLDLFAGTGALGFEALSRGAAHAVFVDHDRQCSALIRKNAEALHVLGETQILSLDLLRKAPVVAKQLAGMLTAVDLVFADAPYKHAAASAQLLDALAASGMYRDDALIVLEYASAEAPPPLGFVANLGNYRYGDCAVSLWQFCQPDAVDTLDPTTPASPTRAHPQGSEP
jgi:16S rRNA (guanine966-N2)-methyltransferase